LESNDIKQYKHQDALAFPASIPEIRFARRTALIAYARLHAFFSQVMPFTDPDFEKLYTFGRHLQLDLPQDPRKTPLKLDGKTILEYYRLHKRRLDRACAGTGGVVHGPTKAGKLRSLSEEVRLSEVIEIFNERFGTNFTKADHSFSSPSVIAEAKADEEVQKRAAVLDNFAAGWLKSKISDALSQRSGVREGRFRRCRKKGL
jgi:type I restriction enzyme, R subunit